MDYIEIEEILKNAHQEYVDWWLPIDIESGSSLAPMSYRRFLDSLLIYDQTTWWDRWIDEKIPKDKIIPFKFYILELIKLK